MAGKKTQRMSEREREKLFLWNTSPIDWEKIKKTMKIKSVEISLPRY